MYILDWYHREGCIFWTGIIGWDVYFGQGKRVGCILDWYHRAGCICILDRARGWDVCFGHGIIGWDV